MKKIAFAAVLMVGLHGSAAAQEWMVKDSGRVSCGGWLEIRAAASDPNDSRFLQVSEWISGFLTAYNYYFTPAGGDVASATDRPGMYAWLDKYCRENPTLRLVQATIVLIEHLEGRYKG